MLGEDQNPVMPIRPSSRRSFLGRSITLAAGACVAPRFSIGKPGPSANSRINIACIGVGGRGAINLKGVSAENIVALCDVDDNNASDSYKAFPKARTFRDFRRMLDQMGKEIDAVLISTPDHTHFAATLASMQLGKHVFCEKPLAHTVHELRTMSRAAAYYKVINQMGNQGHSTDGIRSVKEWVGAGVIGEVLEVSGWMSAINFDGRFFGKAESMPPAATRIPDHIDWDLWLGPCTKKIAYNPIYTPRKWRGFYDFGSGLLGDWSCHTLDAPFWSLNPGMPVAVELEQKTGGSEAFCPDHSTVRFEFAPREGLPPLIFRWHEGKPLPENRPEWGLDEVPGAGMIMTGKKGSIMTGNRPNSPRLLPKETWLDFRKNPTPKSIPRIKEGHYQEWTSAIRGDGPKPGSDFAYGAQLTELALIGVLAQRFGGRIEYDAKTMKITNRPELNSILNPPVRNGWEYTVPS